MCETELESELELLSAPDSLLVSGRRRSMRVSRLDGRVEFARCERKSDGAPCSPGSAESRPGRIFGVLGSVDLSRGTYLIVITERQLVGRLRGHEVWRVGEARIVPYAQEEGREDPGDDENRYLALLKEVLAMPLYFSYTLDLTSRFQRSFGGREREMWRGVDRRFWWNRYLITRLLSLEKDDSVPEGASAFILPVMMGSVTICDSTVDGRDLQLALISRRHTRRAGARYLVRGIDRSGAVANFVETEQILVDVKNNALLSFVQLRGSIPLFWSQPLTTKYTPDVRINRSPDALEAFLKHFDDIRTTYDAKLILCVSLVNQLGKESHLAKEYIETVEKAHYPNLTLVSFDFHKHCSGNQYHNLELLHRQIDPYLDSVGWFHCLDGQALQLQHGVIRTNCIDNLDRSNLVQSSIASKVLVKQLQLLSLTHSDHLSSIPNLFRSFRHAWADNADALSVQYAGTRALKTDYTRTGKRGYAGMLSDAYHSVLRYLLNNFKDGSKQDAYNLFLGIYRVQPNAPSPFERDRGRKQTLTMLALILCLLVSIGLTPSFLKHTLLAPLCWAALLAAVALLSKKYGSLLVCLPCLSSSRAPPRASRRSLVQ
ncbi:phosphatidylinositol-3-phosphatase SAC1-like [Schistocerca gregaria]|uniref:phosphatidylinositol-3-phosphatase SAC1-like n=1 Tax=Schistocerca gregaria TaxID=7010 RepID=UPI00211EE604|nr:phosphatidylinositol-3-phosphatase SAC1-like [Schistocerca gregaria]